MSTKIYNGLILRNHNLEQALAKLIPIRQTCISAGVAATAKLITEELVLQRDLACNYSDIKTKGDPNIFTDLMAEFRAAWKKVLGEGVRDVTWDATFDVCLMPSGGDVLVTYYLEQDLGYRQALLDAGFEDYHYQDSTERPQNISEADWELRCRTWNALLPGRTSPRDVGLLFQAVTWDDLYDAFFRSDMREALVPSEDERRKAVSTRLTELGPGVNMEGMGMWAMVDCVTRMEPERRSSVMLCDNPLD
ncbi:hypothetical protein [Stutzerimonas stutzeri]|uniref:hypothetical protein n=1 Tax=Stutzerimonas stutzeri TaxID=316 RepID=UPI001BCECCC4|nr:hypothetical protein [Stutzerimonas stutzeri]